MGHTYLGDPGLKRKSLQQAMVSGRRRAGTLAMLGLMLAGCSTNGPAEPPTAALAPPPGQGQTQTRAPVKIALLLPMGGMGETAAIAKSMKQGAEMALFELNDPNVELITKDDGGTAARARVAADEAIKEGAEIIVGPLLSQSVQGRRARRPSGEGAGAGLLQQHAGCRAGRLSRQLPRRSGGRSHRFLRRFAGQTTLRRSHSR